LILTRRHASMQFMQANATRRRAILILGSAAAASIQAQTAKPGTAIHQEVDFSVGPARIYEALLDAKQFSAFTGAPAQIQRQPGGSFNLFGGHILGRNIELERNQRVVQAWREVSWPAGVYSLVKFELVARGSETHLVFDHTGISEDDWGHLNEGWPLRYWDPLRKYLNA